MTEKLPIQKTKSYYDVKVETQIFATLHYRVFADDEKQASEMIKNMTPNSIKHRLAGKRDIKLLVYDAGCSIIKFMLRFR